LEKLCPPDLSVGGDTLPEGMRLLCHALQLQNSRSSSDEVWTGARYVETDSDGNESRFEIDRLLGAGACSTVYKLKPANEVEWANPREEANEQMFIKVPHDSAILDLKNEVKILQGLAKDSGTGVGIPKLPRSDLEYPQPS
jgi:hypothetical protein